MATYLVHPGIIRAKKDESWDCRVDFSEMGILKDSDAVHLFFDLFDFSGPSYPEKDKKTGKETKPALTMPCQASLVLRKGEGDSIDYLISLLSQFDEGVAYSGFLRLKGGESAFAKQAMEGNDAIKQILDVENGISSLVVKPDGFTKLDPSKFVKAKEYGAKGQYKTPLERAQDKAAAFETMLPTIYGMHSKLKEDGHSVSVSTLLDIILK